MQVSTSLDVKELERLDELAEKFGLSRSAVLRLIVTGALKNWKTLIGVMSEDTPNIGIGDGTN